MQSGVVRSGYQPLLLTRGEYLIATPHNTDLFVELKAPGWESELTPSQLAAGSSIGLGTRTLCRLSDSGCVCYLATDGWATIHPEPIRLSKLRVFSS
jgi:hypothetical protein